MSPDERCKAFGAAFAARQAGDIPVSGVGGLAVGEGDGLIDDDQTAGVGQFNFGRFDRPDLYRALFEASVAFVRGADKKGDWLSASFSAVRTVARRESLVWTR